MAKILTISAVKTQFPKVVRGVERKEEEIVVTRNGKPACVIISYDEFVRLRETLDVLTDPTMLEQIRKSRTFFRKHRKALSFEQVFDELLS